MKNEKLLKKRQQFEPSRKGKLPLIAAVIAIVIFTSVFFFFKTDSEGEAIGEFFGESVAEPRSYLGELHSMENVEPIMEDGRIKVPLNEVDRNNIVYFEVENNEGFIARAIVNGPPVILADEPTGSLDTRTGDEIMELFQELNAEGLTILMVTHNPDNTRYMGRTVLMQDGRLITNSKEAETGEKHEALPYCPEQSSAS